MAFPSIKASAKGGKDFAPVPVGVHMAICTQVIHLGVQPGGKYADKDQVYLKFELPEVRVEWEKNGQKMEGPATIGRTFGLSIGEKSNLGPFLEGWRGKPFTLEEKEAFNITSVLGKICQLSVVHEVSNSTGKTYASASGAFQLIQLQKDQLKADPALSKAQGELIAYTPVEHDQAVFEKLPEWLQIKIKGRVKEQPVEDVSQVVPGSQDFNDDIPF
jgi:hypothetical protein